MLAVRLDPVQAQSVQECGEPLNSITISIDKVETLLQTLTSMMHKMHTVNTNQNTPMTKTIMTPVIPGQPITPSSVISHSTSDN